MRLTNSYYNYEDQDESRLGHEPNDMDCNDEQNLYSDPDPSYFIHVSDEEEEEEEEEGYQLDYESDSHSDTEYQFQNSGYNKNNWDDGEYQSDMEFKGDSQPFQSTSSYFDEFAPPKYSETTSESRSEIGKDFRTEEKVPVITSYSQYQRYFTNQDEKKHSPDPFEFCVKKSKTNYRCDYTENPSCSVPIYSLKPAGNSGHKSLGKSFRDIAPKLESFNDKKRKLE
ncbi:hypothetical protein WICPIJ_007312 [Wickerhamomyces pijperi]|uniref:Uncharacterized protein n=1 Tax=Wickerhamomyces pijperi TaxID=599730 RepID=A0A9P8TK66_WICPI|nr:hypothetical protein WICPIJ_007312 [Wickerhamomyces pijperi]